MAKQYSREFKEKLVQESLETGNVYLVARNYNVAPATLHQWVSKQKKYGSVSLKDVDMATKVSVKPERFMENSTVTKENETLKKLLGEKELEIEILKDLLKKTNPQLYAKLK